MYFVGVCGASGSGKSTVCKKVIEGIGGRGAVLMMDSFYKSTTEEDLADIMNYNFDHPNAFDFDKIREVLNVLKETGRADIPKYSFVTHQRLDETEVIEDVDVVIFEGILSLHEPEIRKLLDITIFVDTDLDTCLARRIRRDMAERGRTVDSVLEQYEKTVKPSYENFIGPLRRHADVIIPRGGSNTKAIQMVTQHIQKQLLNPALHQIRDENTAYNPLTGLVRSSANSPIMSKCVSKEDFDDRVSK
eukprot:TRINITY_DN5606_c1_g1_i1.p1 TRINITY_DN5606_c1_g1~~TRINITY_DN5606_c1_g1_i1.p1  ORF type:complete len:247 (+),score=52.81 TRINITY_DN5606_c1_g1_i1:55-795(+)